LGAPVLKEHSLFHRPDGFAQANAEVNDALVARSIEWLRPEGTQVLELYSGNGNFTFAIAAEAAHVTAIESSAISVQLAQQAARGLTTSACCNQQVLIRVLWLE
jgi:23S rRNA (uracil1939-C5)-methyltransferase